MPKGYFIARVTVTNHENYAAYAAAASKAIALYGGAPLVRGGTCEVLEGEGRARNVVIEFPSFEQAKAYYHSPEYQAAKLLRQDAGIADMIAVEGA
jgi:uncharacterized protein (DUF1330 family)